MTDPYAFDYGRIRLRAVHYEQWKRAYRFLDLDRELTSIADNEWFQRQDNWFFVCSQMLAKRDRKAQLSLDRARMIWNGFDGVL